MEDASPNALSSTESALVLSARTQIQSLGTARCMDTGGTFNAGSPIVQYDCLHYPDQQFTLSYATFTTFQIVSNIDPGKCVAANPSGVRSQAQDHDSLTLAACLDSTGIKPLNARWYVDSSDLGSSVSHGRFRSALFTGASEAQPGMFRAAHHGTLFLDEIGELPPEQQPKLLRALERSEVVPVGGTEVVPVDVRVIAATNRELAAAVESGAFRRDLYARLSLWEVQAPPLRQRRVDVLGWVARLHRRWIEKRAAAAPAVLRFSPDAAEALLLCAWRSNLRDVDRLVHELQQSAGGTIELDQLPAWVQPAAPRPHEHAPVEPQARAPIPVPSREEFEAAFARLGGSVRALAREFGRDRRQIYRWLAAYGLKGRSDPR